MTSCVTCVLELCVQYSYYKLDVGLGGVGGFEKKPQTNTVSVCLYFPCSSQPSVTVSHWHSGENCLVCRRHFSVCACVCAWNSAASGSGLPKLKGGRCGSVPLLMRLCEFEACVRISSTAGRLPNVSFNANPPLFPLYPFISLPIHPSIRHNYWWNDTSGKCMRGDLCRTAIKPQPVSPSLFFPCYHPHSFPLVSLSLQLCTE